MSYKSNQLQQQPLLDPSTLSPGIIATELSHEPEFQRLDDDNGDGGYAADRLLSQNASIQGNYGSIGAITEQNKHQLRCPEIAGAPEVPSEQPYNGNHHSEDSNYEPLSKARLRIILLSIYISIYLGALDTTIVATLLTIIASELNALPLVSWIATSYLLSCSAFQPLFGKLSDIFGRRSLLLLCNAMFIFGCLLCGVTNSFWVLVIGRFITGIGGGGFNTLGTITMSDIIPLRKRGVYQGYGNIAFGLGAASGGVVAGFCQSYFGWRMAFLAQIPICLIAGACIFLYLNLPPGSPGLGAEGNDVWKKLRKVDVLGSVILVTSLIMFMAAASLGGKTFAYDSAPFLVLVISSIVGLTGFYFYELLVATEPVIPVYLLKQPTVIFSSLNCWFMSMTMFSYLYFAPFFWISVKQLTATDSGVRLISNFFGVSSGSVLAGIYMKKTGRYYYLAILSGVITIVGVLQLYFTSVNTSKTYELLVLFFPGFGCAIMLTVSLVAMISSVNHKEQALTTSIQYGFRSTGSTLGVSVATACFQESLQKNLINNFKHLKNIPPQYAKKKILNKIIDLALHDSNYAHDSAPEFAKNAIIGAYDTACHAAFLFALITCVMGVICNFFINEHRLLSSVNRK